MSVQHDTIVAFRVIPYQRAIRVGCHWIACDWYEDIGMPATIGDLEDAARAHAAETGHA